MSEQVFDEGVSGVRFIDIGDKVRRTLDLAISVVLLLILMLPMFLIAAAVRMDSDGPALFRQRRVGRNGRMFTILTFRTMQTTGNDDRLRDLIARELQGADTSE